MVWALWPHLKTYCHASELALDESKSMPLIRRADQLEAETAARVLAPGSW